MRFAYRLAPLGLTLSLLTSRAAIAQDSLARRVDSVFAAWDRTTSPGCALAVYRDGAIAYARGYGMANLELGVAIGTRTVFDIGSTSKQFTAMSVALVARDDKLSLDDDIRRHLPELPPYARGITIRQLIHHTSGLRDYLTLMSLAGVRFDDWTGDDEALAIIARQRATNFAPGSEWLYSNSGYFLLSLIVKRVSGKTLSAFARERLFEPLGMRHTHFHDDHTMVVPQRATGYTPKDSGGFQIEMSNFEQTGDGGVYTTVEDLLLWDRNFYDGRVGGRTLIDSLQIPDTLTNGRPLDYAFGLRIGTEGGARTVRHGGSWAGYRAELLRFPEHHLSVACLCNLSTINPSELADRVARVYLAGVLAPEATATAAAEQRRAPGVTLPREALTAWEGVWRDPRTGEVRRIRLEGDRLMIGIERRTPLVPLSEGRFQVGTGSAEITFEVGAPARMHVRSGAQPPVTYERVPTVRPSTTQLAEFAGRYYGAELDATYTVTVAGERLRVSVLGRELLSVEPTYLDAFSDGFGHLTFRRDARRRITGFTLQAGRVRNLDFTRGYRARPGHPRQSSGCCPRDGARPSRSAR